MLPFLPSSILRKYVLVVQGNTENFSLILVRLVQLATAKKSWDHKTIKPTTMERNMLPGEKTCISQASLFLLSFEGF